MPNARKNHFARHNDTQPRPAVVVDCDHRAMCGNAWQPESLFRGNHNVAVFHFGTREHCAVNSAHAWREQRGETADLHAASVRRLV